MLATSGVITVVANTVASVTPSVTTLAAGSSLNARIANGPAGRFDWVGLFTVGASNPVARFYLNGSVNAPATGLSSANVPFVAPQQAGQYQSALLRQQRHHAVGDERHDHRDQRDVSAAFEWYDIDAVSD